jgi:epoxyqueuosine reductase
MPTLEERLLAFARRLGFALAGIAPATPADNFDKLSEWLERGHAGEMGYMHRHAEARRHPRGVYPAVRSVVMVGMSYDGGEAPTAEGPTVREGACECEGPTVREGATPPRGGSGALPDGRAFARVARYARGPDYHHVLRDRLKQLGAWLQAERPGCRGRAVVDTAPLLERDFARRAGLGWFGKNTMLIHPRRGSWFVLGGLLCDLDLTPTGAFETSHCGTCTRCLDACPTGAFVAPRVLDARRCISYLTIELRRDVPEELREGIGDWLFGCDVCQEVCPWNRKAPAGEAALAPRGDLAALDARELLALDDAGFRARFEGTALYPRPGRAAVLRNAALVLGNVGDASALPALRTALNDDEAIVREAAAWAIGRVEKRLASAL